MRENVVRASDWRVQAFGAEFEDKGIRNLSG